MLHDLANDDGFVALKWAAEDREVRRHRERMTKTYCAAKDYSDDETSDVNKTKFLRPRSK